MQYHALSCKTMPYHAIPCNIMQYHAIPCNTMQYHAIPCNTMQYHAIPCTIMQYHAIQCNTMQFYAIQCNTMQYHASVITADGAYHCPVGSIMAIFINKHDDFWYFESIFCCFNCIYWKPSWQNLVLPIEFCLVMTSFCQRINPNFIQSPCFRKFQLNVQSSQFSFW